MTNPHGPAEPEKRTVRIVALCIVCATIITVFGLTCKMRALRAEVERLDAAYREATESLRETTALLEAILNDLEPGD